MELLTKEEHEAVHALASAYRLMQDICGTDETRSDDLREFAAIIHAGQNFILAQAAARAYPDLYRLAGGPK